MAQWNETCKSYSLHTHTQTQTHTRCMEQHRISIYPVYHLIILILYIYDFTYMRQGANRHDSWAHDWTTGATPPTDKYEIAVYKTRFSRLIQDRPSIIVPCHVAARRHCAVRLKSIADCAEPLFEPTTSARYYANASRSSRGQRPGPHSSFNPEEHPDCDLTSPAGRHIAYQTPPRKQPTNPSTTTTSHWGGTPFQSLPCSRPSSTYRSRITYAPYSEHNVTYHFIAITFFTIPKLQSTLHRILILIYFHSLHC